MKLNVQGVGLMVLIGLVSGCVPKGETASAPVPEIMSKDSVTVADKARVEVHSRMTLGQAALAGFTKFKQTGGVHGAFYVTRDGSSFSWRSRRYSVEDAMLAAQTDCEAFYQTECELYATLVPAAPRDGRFYLRDQSRDTWEKAIRNTRAGNVIAIAANKTGASGFAWDFSNAAEARAAAIRTCVENAAALPKDSTARVVAANEAAGVYQCRIVGVFR